ncbi:hypothetical protein Bpla01_60330 [Burkholderia plantarii]|nr:hypothetical protein Bpla01_60330 [Burkholderia plantarii]
MAIREFVGRDDEFGLGAVDDAEHECLALPIRAGSELNRRTITGLAALGVGNATDMAVQ